MDRKREFEYRKPSERAAGFVLSLFGWVKDIIGSTSKAIPPGRAVEHRGKLLAPGVTLRYPAILLVEDNPNTAEGFVNALESYYAYGSVMIFVAHTYGSAVSFFDNENVSLVVMDSDLDDEEGDGADLVRRFLQRKPGIPILANSSRKISNMKLTGLGAMDSLGKNQEKLKAWLHHYDPAGAGEWGDPGGA